MGYEKVCELMDFTEFEKAVKEAKYVEWKYDIPQSGEMKSEEYWKFVDELKEAEAFTELSDMQDNRGMPSLSYDEKPELFDEMLWNVRQGGIILNGTKVAKTLSYYQYFYGCGLHIALMLELKDNHG